MADETLHCGRCDLTKPRADFYEHRHNGRPRKPCKACLAEKRRERYVRRDGDRDSYDQVLRREYGVTIEWYDEQFRKQAGRCAVCHRGETVKMRNGKIRRLSVDHDHVTGAVRGLLCHRCNLLVWALEDNHTTLDAIRDYITQWRDTFAAGPPLAASR